MIRIINIRNYKLKENELLIKVDRSSILGNPYYMANESLRNKVCDQYQEYFNKNIKSTGAFRNEVIRIHDLALKYDIALACWCYPKRCHAETIKAFIEKYLYKEVQL